VFVSNNLVLDCEVSKGYWAERILFYFCVSSTFFCLFFQDSAQPDPLAKAHLDLLSQLIGASVTKSEFRLNLFKDDQEEE
jgi:hypothetical protein